MGKMQHEVNFDIRRLLTIAGVLVCDMVFSSLYSDEKYLILG